MLTEASISTAHGSSHGLVPQVQYSEHFSSPDIHTHHHSAPSTIFTPGESLATDPHLISGSGPSTVTQDEPIDEVMMSDKSNGPDSYCCSCLLVWNSVKDYWERLYGSVVYSITKLLIGILLSIAKPKCQSARSYLYFRGRKVLKTLFRVYSHRERRCWTGWNFWHDTLFTGNRSIFSLCSHGNLNGWASDFCGSAWMQYLNAQIFNGMKILPVPGELTPEGFPGWLSVVLLDQSRVVSGCICYLKESVDVFFSGACLSYFWSKILKVLKRLSRILKTLRTVNPLLSPPSLISPPFSEEES